eukprot:2858596-Ditylum_brightwellii.AAC.1
MLKVGHIDEEIYDDLGYPPDFDPEEEDDVDQHVGIEREHIQHIKMLTHSDQILLRNKYKDRQQVKKDEKKECAKQKLKLEHDKKVEFAQNMIDGNKLCKMHLL